MKKGKRASKADAKKYFFELEVLDQALLQLNASEIISQAFLEMASAQHFELYPSIVGRQKIGEFGFGGSILQEQTCNWNDSDVVLDGQEVEACPMSVMIEICQWDIERSFIAANQPMNKAMDEIVPADFQAVIQQRVTEKLGEELEYITWQGDTDLDAEVYESLALCDGLEKKAHEYFVAGDIVPGQIVTNVEVDETNVISVLKDAFKKIPVQLRKKKAQLKWFVSQNIADSYLIATAAQSNEIYFLTDRPLNFLGIEMVEASGASDNVQFISRKVNFAKLTDMLTETPKFNVVNMSATTNEPKWRIRTDLKYGVDMLNQNEFVLMLPVLTPVLTSRTPTSGAAASTVTLTGSSFTGATAVIFGASTEATFTVVDDETITATVPALGAGATTIKVVTNAGTTSTVAFTVS